MVVTDSWDPLETALDWQSLFERIAAASVAVGADANNIEEGIQ